MDEKNQAPLASEMYKDLKETNKFKDKLIFALVGVICLLIGVICAQHFYHIQKWSEFETIVVDSGEGTGNANYIGGDNTGGVFNGESGSPSQESEQQG